MAVVMTMRWAGIEPAQYEELRDVVGWETEQPPGAIYHCAAFDDTGIRVTDVWETAEDFEQFAATRLMPGVHKVGALGEPTVEIHPVHATYAPAYRTGPGATPKGNLETTIRVLFDEAVNVGNYAAIDACFAPEFVSHMGATDLPLAGFKDYVAAWRTSFPDIHCSVENVIVQDDRIAWTVRATGTHQAEMQGIPATGRRVDFLSVNEARAGDDGRFVEHWVVMDTLGMLQQLGVVPQL
jgi:predicted ester cyclase